MKPVELKVARIGNSRGVRIPAATLERYRIGSTLVMEERSDGILLRPTGQVDAKLSWEDTARAMTAKPEDWSAWDAATVDGVDDLQWDSADGARPVAESTASNYKLRRSRKR